MHSLKYGDTKWLRETWVARGKDERNKPEALKTQPKMHIRYSFYYSSFWELSTTRVIDGGYIPWTAINLYAQRWGLTNDNEFDSFLYIIRGIDNKYVQYLAKERDK